MTIENILDSLELTTQEQDEFFDGVKDTLSAWTDDEVKNYLVAYGSEHNLLFTESSLEGIGVHYHERAEMNLMEPLVDSFYGEGKFKKAVQSGDIQSLEIYT